MTDEPIDRDPLTQGVELYDEQPPSLLASNALWVGGSLLAVVFWVAIWNGCEALFDFIYSII